MVAAFSFLGEVVLKVGLAIGRPFYGWGYMVHCFRKILYCFRKIRFY